MKKRGQISSHIFFYILAAIILGAILLFGIKAFRSLDAAKDEAELISFESKIRTDLENIAQNYGDISFKNYRFPANLGEVVFVDTNINTPTSISAGLTSNYPVIADKIKDSIKDSVYLFDSNENFLKSIDAGKLSIEGPGWIAYNDEKGRFTVKIEGKGDQANVGGKFEKIAELINNKETEINVEEIPGLKLVLTPQDISEGKAKVALRIKKAVGADILTDNIEIQTLTSNGEDYPSQITFTDSYIQIPLSEEICGSEEGPGQWVISETIRISPEENKCFNEEDLYFAKYSIVKIPLT